MRAIQSPRYMNKGANDHSPFLGGILSFILLRREQLDLTIDFHILDLLIY